MSGQPAAVAPHPNGERTSVHVDGATVRLIRLDGQGVALSHAVLHTSAPPGELVTTMATALAPPSPGGAVLRVAGETVTLVVRTAPGDMLVCRLRYCTRQGYRLLRRTLVRATPASA
ncbi:hypothetical protein [Pseudoduganella armeniaca]|uniref:Uncharacterized protein n=1 Tax=Pseudoduganella armeniaca TaxID=2072590 RepID=A0A2R4C4C1_9BURK|nr:hypothetical protein [Pseudoduganella armeniaca]AVR94476.1 hypothetical protein C9I28_01200 [Pseudoduganella armeniaca]